MINYQLQQHEMSLYSTGSSCSSSTWMGSDLHARKVFLSLMKELVSTISQVENYKVILSISLLFLTDCQEIQNQICIKHSTIWTKIIESRKFVWIFSSDLTFLFLYFPIFHFHLFPLPTLLHWLLCFLIFTKWRSIYIKRMHIVYTYAIICIHPYIYRLTCI